MPLELCPSQSKMHILPLLFFCLFGIISKIGPVHGQCALDCGSPGDTKQCIQDHCKCKPYRDACSLSGCWTSFCMGFCKCIGRPGPPPPPPPPKPAVGLLGVDVSTLVSADSFKCMVRKNFTYALVRAWRSKGKFDDNAVANIRNAWAGGMTAVDGYIYPNATISPKEQAQKLISKLDAGRLNYGRLWVDIEEAEWDKNATANIQFIKTMVATLLAHGKLVGIYTRKTFWDSSVLKNSRAFSDLPLWYARYDGKKNFDDFTPFGGWKAPVMKQYANDTALCKAMVDLNWKPSYN